MKRSEMVLKIETFLNDTVTYPPHNLLYEADSLLKLIESNGMTPPFNHDLFIKEFHRSNWLGGGHEWEPEDEK